MGKDCIAYRNTGSHGSPTWVAVTAFKDLDGTSTRTKWDASRRAMGIKQYGPGMLDFQISGSLVWKPADAGSCAAIRDAHFNGTSIDMAFASGNIATPGTEYWRAEWLVEKFKRGEKLEEGVMVDVDLVPFATANAPSYVEVT